LTDDGLTRETGAALGPPFLLATILLEPTRADAPSLNRSLKVDTLDQRRPEFLACFSFSLGSGRNGHGGDVERLGQEDLLE
jgi:hypothetical protein